MKHKISFLVVLAFALNAGSVCASECIGDDCKLAPVEIEETVEVLAPSRYEITWKMPVQEVETCQYDYNCPFETAVECSIWYKKPLYTTNVLPRTPHINPMLVDDMILAIYTDPEVSGNAEVMSPLMQRYHMLMNASDACCTAGIIYKMRENGADDDDVYQFLKDDANRFAITKRCLVTSDDEITSKYSNGVTGEMVADVRNACLCKNRQWFDTLLQPFSNMYELIPIFESSPFLYQYTDSMQRDLTVSVNSDVQNTIGMLSACPK